MPYESLENGNMMWTIIWVAPNGELRECRSLGPASQIDCLRKAQEKYPALIAIIPGYNYVYFGESRL